MATQSEPRHENVRRDIKATRLALRAVLAYTEAMFRHRNTLEQRVYDKALDTSRKILTKVVEEPETRAFVGESPTIWSELVLCFREALPVVEAQSCQPSEVLRNDHESSHAALMFANQETLLKDLERLEIFVLIARNIVSVTNKAQNLAAEAFFEQEILKYIELSTRVAARIYDGDANGMAETAFQNIAAAFKKLLVSCLQFLHNLIQQNEHRKLLLWLDLFGNSKSSDPYFTATFTRVKSPTSETVVSPEESAAAQLENLNVSEGDDIVLESNAKVSESPSMGPGEKADHPVALGQVSAAVDVDHRGPSEQDVLDVAEKVYPNDMPLEELDKNMAQNRLLDQVEEEIGKYHPKLDGGTGGASAVTQPPAALGPDSLARLTQSSASHNSFPVDKSKDEIQETDHHISKSPQAAAEILRQAKTQLMARLRSPGAHSESSRPTDPNPNPSVPQNEFRAEGHTSSPAAAGNGETGAEYQDQDAELQYPSIGDSERGLLTDIPLVLGPNEIEALPLLIQRGIVPPLNGPILSPKEEQEQNHMHTVRCNILLAQDAGRNLLRELLIFIVAWEVKDKEFYFRLMTQIMKAILNNGLMPFAYQTFGEVKDIVSPAQAIIIKIVTQLFRLKQYNKPPYGYHVKDGESPLIPKRVDLLIVRYMFTVFRQSIIPETCSLIYLQGQIRQGAAFPEDFPLTLWDMERVYEGVYQFLEFFAVLTESETWKELLIRWEIVSELTTLLRELDQAIPKAPLTPAQQAREANDSAGTAVKPQATQSGPSTSTPIVERPYDPIGAEDSDSVHALASESPMQDFDNQDPCDFEWKNLKKLVILVLSSLVWKSVPVQEQIREYGGVELVLSCCNYDRYNPYIREHAIMCLRFLLEGNPKNQEIVEKLEARKVVPSEVLDSYGYETFIDKEGKVGLRPKAPLPEEATIGTTVVEL